MRLVAINYATEDYLSAARAQARDYGIPVKTYQDEKKHIRGNGWWRWKPKIILDALMGLGEDEALIYFDSRDVHTQAHFDFAKEYLTDNPLLLRKDYHPHIRYTKGDCYALMDCMRFFNEEPIQLEAGFIGLRKTDFTLAFMKEWSKWLDVDKVVNDDPSEYPNHSSFIDHRHDQSVLTNLALIHDLPMVPIHGIDCNKRP